MEKCKCKNWKENIKILDSAVLLYNNHGFGSLKKSFTYCPYCGKKLVKKEQS